MERPWLDLARNEIGTKEFLGPSNNPQVVQYYVDAVGRKHADAVPWCAAFVNSMLVRAGLKGWGNLMARGALKWGRKLTEPIPGAIVVFPRGKPPSGHVAIVESVTPTHIVVIGGNQQDAVTRKTYPRKAELLGYRWPLGVPIT